LKVAIYLVGLACLLESPQRCTREVSAADEIVHPLIKLFLEYLLSALTRWAIWLAEGACSRSIEPDKTFKRSCAASQLAPPLGAEEKIVEKEQERSHQGSDKDALLKSRFTTVFGEVGPVIRCSGVRTNTPCQDSIPVGDYALEHGNIRLD
jgi:hypothetical protein